MPPHLSTYKQVRPSQVLSRRSVISQISREYLGICPLPLRNAAPFHSNDDHEIRPGLRAIFLQRSSAGCPAAKDHFRGAVPRTAASAS